jgi:ABC-type antimicrobial peptide transport system permease subunit
LEPGVQNRLTLGEIMLVGRARTSEVSLLKDLRASVEATDSRVGLLQAKTMRSAIDEVRYPRRVAVTLLSASGLTGLLLAAVGLYGVVSYGVAQRQRELGIRAALGASERRIASIVLKEGALTVIVGLILGSVLSFVAIKIVSNRLIPIPPLGLTSLAGSVALISLVMLVACYVPARRAAQTDPIVVLRRL